MPPPVIQAGYGYIGVGKQTVQGTPVAPTDFFLFDKESYKPNITSVLKHTGADQQVAYSIVTKQMPQPSVTFPLTSNTGLEMLAWALGGTDTVTGAADPYSHSFGLANDVPWLSIERAIGNQTYIERIADCKLDQWSLSAKEADQVWLSVNAVGGASTSGGSAATVTYDADAVFMFRDGAFVLNSTTLATVVGLTLTVKRNIKDHRTNTVVPTYLVPTNREITVSMDLLFETTNAVTIYNNIVHAGTSSGTTKTPFIGALTATFDPGATPDHQVVLTIPKLAELDAQLPLNPSGDAQMLTITGTAVRPSVGGNEISVTGKNATATAYN